MIEARDWRGGRPEDRDGSEGGRSGGHRNSVSGVTAMNRLRPSADDRRFGPERESGERRAGRRRAAPVRAAPARASRPFLPSNRTHPRAPTHTYSALRTHLFTLNSAENRRARTPSRRAPATSVGYPVPNPSARGPRARPRAGPFTTLPAHDADATLHRAPAMPAHTRTRTLLSLTRDRYIHTNYKLTLFRTCAGSTFVWARRMRRGGDGGN